MVTVTIPGEPLAQERPRFARHGRFVRTYDAPKSRSWKACAQQHMLFAMAQQQPLQGPVAVEIVAVFTCPKGASKRASAERRPHTKARGDSDNIAKACLDAANGVLWVDDSQVWDLRVRKYVGQRGEAPGITLTVSMKEGQ